VTAAEWLWRRGWTRTDEGGDLPTWWHPLHGNLGHADAMNHERAVAAQEERGAWVRFAAACTTVGGGVTAAHAAGYADSLLAEYRRRFGEPT